MDFSSCLKKAAKFKEFSFCRFNKEKRCFPFSIVFLLLNVFPLSLWKIDMHLCFVGLMGNAKKQFHLLI